MKKIFGNWWLLTVLGAVVVALILAVGLPLFVGLLRPWWVRLTCVLLVAAIVAIVFLVKLVL